MVLSGKYFQRALAFQNGKAILAVQFLLVAAAMYVFFRTIPWLASSNISEISKYDEPSPPPPSWARAFSVEHGTFNYYADSRASNAKRMYLYIGLNVIFIVPDMLWAAWIWLEGGRRIEKDRKNH